MENHEFATEVGEMKITKEMLANMRFLVNNAWWLQRESSVVKALLDERKALRVALAHTLPVGPDGEAVVDAALALGEDEE